MLYATLSQGLFQLKALVDAITGWGNGAQQGVLVGLLRALQRIYKKIIFIACPVLKQSPLSLFDFRSRCQIGGKGMPLNRKKRIFLGD